jgi:hypothetical protein
MELGLPSRSLDNKQLPHLLLRQLQILEVLAEAVEDHQPLVEEQKVVEYPNTLLVKVVPKATYLILIPNT